MVRRRHTLIPTPIVKHETKREAKSFMRKLREERLELLVNRTFNVTVINFGKLGKRLLGLTDVDIARKRYHMSSMI